MASSKGGKSKKKNKVRMQSTETSHYYTKYKSAQKNKPGGPVKLELMMFDPIARKHVLYKEAKIKS